MRRRLARALHARQVAVLLLENNTIKMDVWSLCRLYPNCPTTTGMTCKPITWKALENNAISIDVRFPLHVLSTQSKHNRHAMQNNYMEGFGK